MLKHYHLITYSIRNSPCQQKPTVVTVTCSVTINIYDHLRIKPKFEFENEFKLTNWNKSEKGQP